MNNSYQYFALKQKMNSIQKQIWLLTQLEIATHKMKPQTNKIVKEIQQQKKKIDKKRAKKRLFLISKISSK